MNPPSPAAPPPRSPPPAGNGCRNAMLLGLAAVLVVVFSLFLYVRRTFNAKPFAPVVLTPPEQATLESKVKRAEAQAEGAPAAALPPVEGPASPPDPRLLVFTEKELNSLLSKRVELKEFAGGLRFDLRDGQIHIDANFPVPEGVPMLGGKNIRVSGRAKGGYADGKLTLTVVSATMGGIEVPNAWVNNLKGRDLGQEFQVKPNQSPGLAQFLAGVETIRVKDDRIEVRLKE